MYKCQYVVLPSYIDMYFAAKQESKSALRKAEEKEQRCNKEPKESREPNL
jgi:hypothetical protein